MSYSVVARLTGRRPRGTFVSGLIATIKTAILLTTGEKPGVRAKSLLTYISAHSPRTLPLTSSETLVPYMM